MVYSRHRKNKLFVGENTPVVRDVPQRGLRELIIVPLLTKVFIEAADDDLFCCYYKPCKIY